MWFHDHGSGLKKQDGVRVDDHRLAHVGGGRIVDAYWVRRAAGVNDITNKKFFGLCATCVSVRARLDCADSPGFGLPSRSGESVDSRNLASITDSAAL